MSATAKFYTYDQNNTGGSFDHQPEAGIGYRVCIEAFTENQAESRAGEIGLYFDGCETGKDCPCCGDRWSRWAEKAESPSYDRKPLAGGWGLPSYIHYLDGRIEERLPEAGKSFQ
jgi:hypothetical protein